MLLSLGRGRRHGPAWWRALLLCAALGLGPAAAARAGERLALIVAGLDKQIYLPVRLAAQLGLFREQGLEVELLTEPSGANAEDVLLVGAAQGVVGAYHHTLDLQARGKAVQAVVLFTRSPGEVELVAARHAGVIRSPADFRGRRLGVTGLGSATELLTHTLARRHGLTPRDYTVLPVGSGASFAQALREGRIDAGMSTEPVASRLIQSGEARRLVDLRSPEAAQQALGQSYPFASLYMQTAWVQSHRAEVQKLVTALVLALRYLQQHSPAEVAAALGLGGEEGALYVRALGESRAMFSPDGLMPEDGPKQVLQLSSELRRQQRARRLDLGRSYTNDFVRQALAGFDGAAGSTAGSAAGSTAP